ncbi:MAG TPA: decarboxylating 6-phosphogluconate dehydrogenase [Acetobacteraceae bacterium]|nr:decarboxylating 6-phosphogluconate dehydrogenase [Acetobacteraceae bacterium]
MQLGMIGLGRMGANMVERLMAAGHQLVVNDQNQAAMQPLLSKGAKGSTNLAEFVRMLQPPRAVWLMLPAGAVDSFLATLTPLLSRGDIVIDGGNSYYHDDIRRATMLQQSGLHYVDVGTSGGIWGRERGYCLMIGGDTDAVRHLDPIFQALAPGFASAPRTQGVSGEPDSAEQGYLHCGPSGAGHFVKMVHNGIEYGLMAAFAEGLNILRHADAGMHQAETDAETTPLRNPEHYQYNIDIARVAELWRRGSVVSSWLLDLTALALHHSPGLQGFSGRVSDSGEGRWTVEAAIDEGVPAPVISAALYARFASRGAEDFADKLLSAMRFGFGGHVEKPAAVA